MDSLSKKNLMKQLVIKISNNKYLAFIDFIKSKLSNIKI